MLLYDMSQKSDHMATKIMIDVKIIVIMSDPSSFCALCHILHSCIGD